MLADLPHELVCLVLSYVGINDLRSAAAVNRVWRDACSDDLLWKASTANDWPGFALPGYITEPRSYRDIALDLATVEELVFEQLSAPADLSDEPDFPLTKYEGAQDDCHVNYVPISGMYQLCRLVSRTVIPWIAVYELQTEDGTRVIAKERYEVRAFGSRIIPFLRAIVKPYNNSKYNCDTDRTNEWVFSAMPPAPESVGPVYPARYADYPFYEPGDTYKAFALTLEEYDLRVVVRDLILGLSQLEELDLLEKDRWGDDRVFVGSDGRCYVSDCRLMNRVESNRCGPMVGMMAILPYCSHTNRPIPTIAPHHSSKFDTEPTRPLPEFIAVFVAVCREIGDPTAHPMRALMIMSGTRHNWPFTIPPDRLSECGREFVQTCRSVERVEELLDHPWILELEAGAVVRKPERWYEVYVVPGVGGDDGGGASDEELESSASDYDGTVVYVRAEGEEGE